MKAKYIQPWVEVLHFQTSRHLLFTLSNAESTLDEVDWTNEDWTNSEPENS